MRLIKIVILSIFFGVVLIQSVYSDVILWQDNFNAYTSGWTPSYSGSAATLYPWTTDETFDPEDPADRGGGSIITNYEPSAYPVNQRNNSNSWNGWVQYPNSTGTISIQPGVGVGGTSAVRFRLIKYNGLSNELGIHKWLGRNRYNELYVEYKIKFGGGSGEDFWWNGQWLNGDPVDPGNLGIIWKFGRVWTGFNPTDYDKTNGQSQPVENTVWTDESNWRTGIWIWGALAADWSAVKNSAFFYLANFNWPVSCMPPSPSTCDSQSAPRGSTFYWDWLNKTNSYGRINSWTNNGSGFDSNGSFSRQQDFHKIRMYFKNRSNPNTADGAFRMWIDNVEITNDAAISPAVSASMSSNPNDYGMNFVRIGDNFNNLTRNIPSSPGYMDVYIDDVVISTPSGTVGSPPGAPPVHGITKE